MSPVDVLVLALLGGVIGLDTVSFPQAMISRPIVAATLGGALLGHPGPGLLLGATLELFAAETLPFGASRYPEWGSASVVGAALHALQPDGRAGSLTTSVLAALVVAWIGGWTMVQLRRLNARWARQRHDAVARGAHRVVAGLQLYGLTADLCRGTALTGTSLLLLAPVQAAALGSWAGGGAVPRAVVASIAGAVALGAAYKIFHAVPRFGWLFLAGLSGGLVVTAIR
jgi:PTS system mannose-specific IIC component